MDKPYPLLQGFYNEQGTSCFVDSVVLAMVAPFALFYDPRSNEPANVNLNVGMGAKVAPGTRKPIGFHHTRFFDGLTRGKYRNVVCNADPATDKAIRENIRLNIVDIMRQLKQGTRTSCTNMRRTLGQLCRMARDIDLSVDQHDASEAYSRLLRAMDYYPMTAHFLRNYQRSNGPGYQSVSKEEPIGLHYIQLSNIPRGESLTKQFTTSTYNVAYEGIDYDVRTETIVLDRVDTYVIHLDRIVQGGFSSQPVRIDPTVTLCTHREGRSYYQTYRLLSVVYRAGETTSIKSGHFATLLVVPTSIEEHATTGQEFTYYDYDDGKPRPRRITEDEFYRIASTRGVMFFYFPYTQHGAPCVPNVAENPALEQLVEMGYDRTQALEALELAQGDVTLALETLMTEVM